MRNYLQFVARERRLLSFGVTFSVFSNFGQTFLISLFVPFFLKEFSLSNASFGTMFSAATLIGAITLPYLGKYMDQLPLKRFSLMVAMALMLSAFTLSVSWHVSILFIGLCLLRLSGQGLSAHTAQTAMTKFFHRERGKALSISELGYPVGEAVLSLVITAVLSLVSWRLAWAGISLSIGILLIPFVYTVLSGDTEEQTKPQPDISSKVKQSEVYKMVFKDKRFYLHLPAVILPAFWATSLFLYQFSIGQQLGWSAPLLASAFVALAVARIISSLAIGPVVDRMGAKTLFPFYVMPIAIGLLFAYWHPGPWSAFVYMFLFGITLGMGGNITSALWVDMYGSETAGSVRSLFTSLIIVFSSLSPLVVGYMIDSYIPVTQILLGAIITFAIATALAFLAFRGETEQESKTEKADYGISLEAKAPRRLELIPLRLPQAAVPVLCFSENVIPAETVKAQYMGRKYDPKPVRSTRSHSRELSQVLSTLPALPGVYHRRID